MKETPSMLQYKKIKEQYPDCILFFRMGDFYETFEDDATITSKVLDITLTSREKGEDRTPMAGIPYHSLMSYLPKMVQSGYKVALCEQLEDPKTVKGIVKRDVVKIITPGTVIESEMNNPKESLYVLSLFLDKKKKGGISYIDVSKGDFYIFESQSPQNLAEVIATISPSEIVLPESMLGVEMDKVVGNILNRIATSYVPDTDFAHGEEYVLQHFGTTSLKGFLSNEYFVAIKAAGALLKYVEDSQRQTMHHVTHIQAINFDETMYLDPSTIANLELISPNGLLSVLDWTHTAMGARLLRHSLIYPLTHTQKIQDRLDSVSFFYDAAEREDYSSLLEKISDIERINARISFLAASPRDFLALNTSLEAYFSLVDSIVKANPTSYLQTLLLKGKKRQQLQELMEMITKTIHPEAGVLVNAGNIIAHGVDNELDELRDMLGHGKTWIKEFQEQEIKRTGIHSLKVHYNKVFGYYIEISNTHKARVPDDYIRKQTLVSSERYITQTLKDKEDMILNSQDRILAIEMRLFTAFKEQALPYTRIVQEVASNIAYLDQYISFASLALRNNYVKPLISDDKVKKPISIKDGRHPVIEQNMDRISYIANDVSIDCATDQILLVTGPNMSGKSSILRMVALMNLMMQIGSFVPASCAVLSVVDRIFSRVGARDSLSTGESTFMVEMNETANILNNATSDSLIILDEIGRGTSTYDGVSIAYAVVEYIHEHIGAKTLFATHYHELIDLENLYKRVKNFNVLVQEDDDDIIFLRKLVRGGTDKSYGIHVAKIAGVPKIVLKRAANVLEEYEKIKEEIRKADIPPLLSLISADEDHVPQKHTDSKLKKIQSMMLEIDINGMTPLEGLNFLSKLYKEIIEND